MKYTDEQLSRILGDCDEGHLKTGGAHGWGMMSHSFCLSVPPRCCINQAAFNEGDSPHAYDAWADAAEAFDRGDLDYESPDKILRSLVKRGWA